MSASFLARRLLAGATAAALLGGVVAGAATGARGGPAAAAKRHTLTFGSSLAHAADAEVNFPVDTSVRNLALAGGGAVRAPAAGQVVAVRLRGYALESRSHARKPRVWFQDLRPRADGSVRVIVTTQGFAMPGQDGIHRFRPKNFFVHAGDYVGFSDNGGFEYSPHGTHFYVLGQVAGSTVSVFSGAGRDMNGAHFTGHSRAGTELLLQATLKTGVRAPR